MIVTSTDTEFDDLYEQMAVAMERGNVPEWAATLPPDQQAEVRRVALVMQHAVASHRFYDALLGLKQATIKVRVGRG